MTQPEIEGPTVPDDESLSYEAAAVAAVTGVLAAELAAVLASAGAVLVGGAAGLALGGILARRLRALRVPDMTVPLSAWTSGAVDLGRTTALPDVPLPPLPPPDVPVRTDLEAVVRTKLDEAAGIAESRPLASKSDLDAVAGRARSGLARAEAATRFSINNGINSGTADVARAVGQCVIWVAERNACLHCLAYAGWATEPDQEFPPGLTYDPAGPLRSFGPLLWPPLHPNCRCRVRLYSGQPGPPERDRSSLDPAARLASEAQRTVVYQWSDYASGAAARRAASALLDQGTTLADSVERRAAAALRSGRKVRGRR